MEYRPAISLLGQPYFTDSVQWNEDDQLAICLQNGIHIVVIIIVLINITKIYIISIVKQTKNNKKKHENIDTCICRLAI